MQYCQHAQTRLRNSAPCQRSKKSTEVHGGPAPRPNSADCKTYPCFALFFDFGTLLGGPFAFASRRTDFRGRALHKSLIACQAVLSNCDTELTFCHVGLRFVCDEGIITDAPKFKCRMPNLLNVASPIIIMVRPKVWRESELFPTQYTVQYNYINHLRPIYNKNHLRIDMTLVVRCKLRVPRCVMRLHLSGEECKTRCSRLWSGANWAFLALRGAVPGLEGVAGFYSMTYMRFSSLSFVGPFFSKLILR